MKSYLSTKTFLTLHHTHDNLVFAPRLATLGSSLKTWSSLIVILKKRSTLSMQVHYYYIYATAYDYSLMLCINVIEIPKLCDCIKINAENRSL